MLVLLEKQYLLENVQNIRAYSTAVLDKKMNKILKDIAKDDIIFVANFDENPYYIITYDIYIRTYCERSKVFGVWQQLTFTTDASTNAIATADNDISVELHPNPTSGIITLSRNGVEKVEVIDAVGKTIMVVENKHIIDLTKLGQGHYTLRITLPEGVAIRKVIRK